MAVIEARGLRVRFGGHMAVDGVDLDVESGAVTGLIGPNGAGKTTIFNALCGLQPLSGGRIDLSGEDVTNLATHQRARRGLARTFQRLELFGSLNVRENLLVAAENRAQLLGGGPHPDAEADRVLDFVGIEHLADVRADTLPTGQARLVELARALVTRPTVLLLDEPASGLDAEESGRFSELLGTLATDGMAVLLVEHDMRVVMSVCSVVHVLDFGKVLAVGSPREIQADAAVLEAYLGATASGVEQ
jgi:branched-chain amino acid transport system ATP-binding protein